MTTRPDRRHRPRPALAALEPRRLLTIVLNAPIDDFGVRPGAAESTIALAGRFTTTNLANITGTVVTLPIEYGAGATAVRSAINVELYDQDTPLTAQNFVNNVDAGRYDNAFFSYASPGGALQAGDYTFQNNATVAIPARTPIPNEFASSPADSLGQRNVRGTLAMAKADPDNSTASASNAFLINVGDNASTLDLAAGGFTVFGHIIGGQSVADGIDALPTYPATSTFTNLPLANYDGNPADIRQPNIVAITDPAVIDNPQSYFTYRVTISNAKLVTGTLDDDGNLDLKYSAKAQGTATVTYTATDLTGAARTDSFLVTVSTPALALTVGTAKGAPKVANGQSSPVDLGTYFTAQSNGATATLAIKNTGKGILTLGDVSLPAGLSLAQPLPATLQPGTTGNLVLLVDTAQPGTISGTVSLTNDATSGPFTFPVTLDVGDGVRLGGVGPKSVTFTDGDGSKATLTYKGPGAAHVGFTGAGLSATAAKGVSTVTGSPGFALGVISITGSSAGTSLASTVKGGDATVTASGLTAAAIVGALTLKGIAFSSGVITLAAGAASLTIASLHAEAVTIGGPVKSISAASISSGTLTLTGALAALTLTGKASDVFSAAAIQAPSIGKAILGQLTPAGAASILTATSIGVLSFHNGDGQAVALKAIVPGDATNQLFAQAGLADGRLALVSP